MHRRRAIAPAVTPAAGARRRRPAAARSPARPAGPGSAMSRQRDGRPRAGRAGCAAPGAARRPAASAVKAAPPAGDLLGRTAARSSAGRSARLRVGGLQDRVHQGAERRCRPADRPSGTAPPAARRRRRRADPRSRGSPRPRRSRSARGSLPTPASPLTRPAVPASAAGRRVRRDDPAADSDEYDTRRQPPSRPSVETPTAKDVVGRGRRCGGRVDARRRPSRPPAPPPLLPVPQLPGGDVVGGQPAPRPGTRAVDVPVAEQHPVQPGARAC